MSFRFSRKNPAGLIIGLAAMAVVVVFQVVLLALVVVLAVSVWLLRWLALGGAALVGRIASPRQRRPERPPAQSN